MGNKNKLVNSGSNYKSLQLQDSLLEFSKCKHSQQKLTKFSAVSGQLVFTKSSGKDSPVTFFSKDISLQCAKKKNNNNNNKQNKKTKNKKKHNNSEAATVAFMTNFEFWESLKLNVFRC